MRKVKQVSKKLSDEIVWEEGTGNVFSDLGFENSEEMLAKAKLTLYINQLIKQKKLTQVEAAKLLGIDQAKISYLHRGRLAGFSMERLVKFINFLNHDVELVIKKTRRRTHYGSLNVVWA